MQKSASADSPSARRKSHTPPRPPSQRRSGWFSVCPDTDRPNSAKLSRRQEKLSPQKFFLQSQKFFVTGPNFHAPTPPALRFPAKAAQPATFPHHKSTESSSDCAKIVYLCKKKGKFGGYNGLHFIFFCNFAVCKTYKRENKETENLLPAGAQRCERPLQRETGEGRARPPARMFVCAHRGCSVVGSGRTNCLTTVLPVLPCTPDMQFN